VIATRRVKQQLRRLEAHAHSSARSTLDRSVWRFTTTWKLRLMSDLIPFMRIRPAEVREAEALASIAWAAKASKSKREKH
jgi:hypothetical protein